MATTKDETPKVYRHSAQLARQFGQTEQLTVQYSFDTVEELAQLVGDTTIQVIDPRQSAVEAKIDEINKKMADAAKTSQTESN